MANEELIYRITCAIYDRLGTGADENTVEQLVTDMLDGIAVQGVPPGPIRGSFRQQCPCR